MRGSRAKKLRKLALQLLLHEAAQAGKTELDPMADYNHYNQANNCVGYAPATNKETGEIMTDTDGTPLITVVNTLPGTITTGFRWRTLYQTLKRRYMKGEIGPKAKA